MKKIIVAACIGNFLEFYNFTAYGFFAPMIGYAFFPAGDWLTSLFYSLMTFAVGFIMRPAGAFVFGHYAQRIGQEATLMTTFVLMAVGSLLLAATPPVASIGVLAPALIVVARILQGFSDGGEVGPATELIFSAAPSRLGGIFASLQYITQLLGALVAVLLGLVLSACLSHDALYSWGWRVPFAAGLAIVPVGLILRRQALPHHAATSSASRPSASDRAILKKVVPVIFLGIMVATVTNYMRQFGVSYAIAVLHLTPLTGMIGMASGLTCGIIGLFAGMGLISRLADPRPFVLGIGGVNALVAVPLYYYAIHVPGLPSQLALNIVMYLLAGLTSVAMWQAMTEALPAAGRAFVFGILYAVAVSTFGGMTQPFVTWLIAHTGNPMMPGYISAVAIPIGLVAWLRLLVLWRERRSVTDEAGAPIPVESMS